MFRVLVLSAPLVLATLHMPAAAQPSSADTTAEGTPCKLSQKKKQGSAIFGNILGGLASRTFGNSPISGYIPFNTVSTTLTDAIACKLDKDEQQKAANATDTAVARGVGASESWESTTRDGVSGSSTVTEKTQLADGSSCMNVTDVVIVNGEETTVPKKMCRKRGATGYAVAV
ncbi:MAG: hypothetical protein ACREB5_00100 [Sphingomonadaceae bacterium]